MRRLPTRLLAAAVLLPLAAGGLSACSVLEQKVFEDDAEVPRKVTAIRVDSGNGGVRVDASADVRTPSVHREVKYRGDKPGGTSFRVEHGVLTLSGCGRNCGVDYVVKVPAGLPVTGGTSNGGLTLNDVGKVDVHTSNGRIKVSKSRGPVKLRTSNGDIEIENAEHGDIDAQTSNGQVTLGTATPQNIKAHSSNGDITVTAPPAEYRISAHATSGGKKLAFGNNPSGRYRLDLSTSNGDLVVRSAGR
ncbi:DUF4097 domain-containing protein [Streptomyces sp. NPDC058045]|uniref:DUF4097 family beta strand repeat-containing protein n=1 Tax=Streptomyces sp. NPDC058045 TaxID=3346311 RepID=UPI0036F044AB